MFKRNQYLEVIRFMNSSLEAGHGSQKHLGRVVAHFLGSDSQKGLAGYKLDCGHASVILLGPKSVVISQDFVV